MVTNSAIIGTRLYVLVDEIHDSVKVSLEKFNNTCKEYIINCIDTTSAVRFDNNFMYNKHEVHKGDTVYVVLMYGYDPVGLDCLGVFTEKPDINFINKCLYADSYLDRVCEVVL